MHLRGLIYIDNYTQVLYAVAGLPRILVGVGEHRGRGRGVSWADDLSPVFVPLAMRVQVSEIRVEPQ